MRMSASLGRQKPLFGKIVIKGRIVCETGLHIGATGASLDIGGLDAPVVRNPVTREPYVPGSSLRGKLRHLLERKENKEFNREGGGVWRHECTDPRCRVCRLFGATGGREGDNLPARLAVRDCNLTPASREKLKQVDTGLQFTELKFENALDRVTAAANPRQIERVPAGAEFSFELVYSVETTDRRELSEDLTNVLEVMRLLEDDALGGHGSRGYGKVRFELESFEGRTLEFYSGDLSGRKVVEAKNLADCTRQRDEIISLFAR